MPDPAPVKVPFMDQEVRPDVVGIGGTSPKQADPQPPKIIAIPGKGNVAFPADMDNEAIGRVIRLHSPEPQPRGSEEWKNWALQRSHDLNDRAANPGHPVDPGVWHGVMESVHGMGSLLAGYDPATGKYGGPLQGIQNLAVSAVDQAKEHFSKAVDAAHGRGEFADRAPWERASLAFGHGLASVLPIIGPAAATAGEHLGGGQPGQGIGEAIALLAPSALGAAAGAAGKAVDAIAPAARPTAEAALRDSAETSYSRVLAPTTKANKLRTAAAVPELIDKGITAFTLKGLKAQAAAHVESLGQAIGDAWDNLPAGTTTEFKPIYDRLQDTIDEAHSVKDAAGNPIPKGPEAARAIKNITNLQQTLMDVAEKDPATGELQIPVDKIRSLRQYFDNVAKKAGRYDGKDLADQSTAEAHGMAADAIRNELAKDHPDIAALNKEYSFWKNVDQVVGDTTTRKQGQAPSLSSRAATAAGFVKGGIVGAELANKLTRAVQTPAWGTVSAVLKSKLADAIAQGKPGTANFYTTRILSALGSGNAVAGEPKLAIAPAQ